MPPHGSVVEGPEIAVIRTMIRVLHALKKKKRKFSKVSGLVHALCEGSIESNFENFLPLLQSFFFSRVLLRNFCRVNAVHVCSLNKKSKKKILLQCRSTSTRPLTLQCRGTSTRKKKKYFYSAVVQVLGH